MPYLDTNILIYASVNQDIVKLTTSQDLIRKLEKEGSLLLSSLVLQEFVYTCSKLKLDKNKTRNRYNLFRKFTSQVIDQKIIDNAFELAYKIDAGNYFNDIIHLKYAEKYCDELITFDKDFKKFIPHTDLKITIL